MKKSILFWTAILCVLFLTARWILNRHGLQFRTWIREPVTLLIAFGTAAGILQLLLRIPLKPVRIAAIVLWAAALIAFCIFGFWILVLSYRHEISSNTDYKGTRCVVEYEPVMWESRRLYYAYYGWFVHGSEVLHKEGYACGPDE
ncbi:MAG: hypothetical protein K6E36_09460 [Oscillospiraceae bacterium]|nr:hypothetical protein [Oscillospiraceae bacterium]